MSVYRLFALTAALLITGSESLAFSSGAPKIAAERPVEQVAPAYAPEPQPLPEIVVTAPRILPEIVVTNTRLPSAP